jgi:hypothetical protein
MIVVDRDAILKPVAAIFGDEQFPEREEALSLIGSTQRVVGIQHVTDDRALSHTRKRMSLGDLARDALEVVLDPAEITDQLPSGGEEQREAFIDLHRCEGSHVTRGPNAIYFSLQTGHVLQEAFNPSLGVCTGELKDLVQAVEDVLQARLRTHEPRLAQ